MEVNRPSKMLFFVKQARCDELFPGEKQEIWLYMVNVYVNAVYCVCLLDMSVYFVCCDICTSYSGCFNRIFFDVSTRFCYLQRCLKSIRLINDCSTSIIFD